MGQDYYKLLGIDKNASEEEIKKAYKKMVSRLISEFIPPTFMTDTPLTGLEMASRP